MDGNTDEPKPVSPTVLKALFATLKDNIRLVILNACYSSISTGGINDIVDCVVGMKTAIGDQAAITFAAAFYRAIGFGRSVKDAFEQGRLALMLEGIPEEATPELWIKPLPPPFLRMPDDCGDIVLLIGAGVSNYLGLPSLDGLLQQTILGDDEIANRIKNTRNAIEAYTNRAKARSEELISQLRYYMDVAELLAKDNTFRNELGSLPYSVDNGDFRRKWRDALTRCYRIILQGYSPQRINQDSVEFKTILELLGELTVINSGLLHVYTTNYDCSFQVLASNCQDLKFLTHINNRTGSFENRWYSTNRALESLDLPSVYVHRFHGCVGWFADPRRPYSVEEVYGVGSNLEIKDDDKLHTMQIKLTSSQSLGTNPAFALAFEEFCEHLKRAKILLVWGYSFRDIEVLRHINQAFSQQTRLSILYIDPYVDKGQVGQYIRSTMGDAPTPIYLGLEPSRIDWKPPDGHDRLVEKVVESVKSHLASLAQEQHAQIEYERS